MKIIINEIPLSKNLYVNQHWSKRKEYKELIAWLIYEQIYCIEDRITYQKATVTFDIYFKDKRRRDVANYLGGGLISWLDVLVDLKLIEDDCYDCIGMPFLFFHIDKANPRTEITIEGRLKQMFNLISKTKLIDDLCMIMYCLEKERDELKAEYDAKAISEWGYYRDLWHLRGRLSMLDEIVNKLGE